MDCYVPITTPQPVRLEVRCQETSGNNDLDIPMSGDLSKKFSMRLGRVAEPQDINGVQTGPRTPLPSFNIPMEEALERSFTAGGVTLKGIQILALYNEIVDAYKGQGL